jgi:hypothetical protein
MDQLDLLLVLAQIGVGVAGFASPGYNRFTMVANFTIMGIVVLDLGISALGYGDRYAGSVYSGSLILMLVGSSTAFFLVVAAFLDPLPRKDSPPR